MKALFLTSSLETNYKDEFGNRIAQPIANKNKLLDNLKKYINKYDNILFAAMKQTMKSPICMLMWRLKVLICPYLLKIILF